MTETKKILLIGRSGRGKSTLANVITGMENKFKESSGSASETKKIQFEEFEFDSEQEKLKKLEEKITSEENNLDEEDKQIFQKILQGYLQNKVITRCCIIDTPGIGDTKMSDNEVLDIIAEAVYLVKDGLSQVLFVVGGRFDQSEMATYNLLRTIIFDKDITQYTTIVRTRFGEFRDKEECQADINSMIKEAEEKRTELEEDLIKREEGLKNLSSNSIEHQKLLKETEQLKKELAATNLAEIIESCQEKVVHIDNPPIEIAGADENELRLNKRKRTRSRKVVLEHLKNSHQEQKDIYKPAKLQELSIEITDYMESKMKLEEELKKLKSNESSSIVVQSWEFKDGKSRLGNFSRTSSKDESTVKKEKKPIENNQETTIKSDNLAIGERTKQLENKKVRLKREIQEKEKIIRQKVLKHIFNNYREISSELGGDILMESVVGDHKWENISPEFKDKELILNWLNEKFDYEQIQKWATALGNTFNPKLDAGFCAWLRNDKQLSVESIKDLSQVYDVEQLRKEYIQYLAQETQMLDEHNQKLNPVVTSQGQQWQDRQWLKEKEFKSENERQKYKKQIENIIKKKASAYDSGGIVKSSIEEIKVYSAKANEDFVTVIVKINTAAWAKTLARIWLPTGKIPKIVYNLWTINHKFDQEGERSFSITKIYGDEDLYEGAFSSLEKANEKKHEVMAELVQQQEWQNWQQTQIQIPPK